MLTRKHKILAVANVLAGIFLLVLVEAFVAEAFTVVSYSKPGGVDHVDVGSCRRLPSTIQQRHHHGRAFKLRAVAGGEGGRITPELVKTESPPIVRRPSGIVESAIAISCFEHEHQIQSREYSSEVGRKSPVCLLRTQLILLLTLKSY